MAIFGLGVGPLLLGPQSEFFGRTRIYTISYCIFFALSWGVPFSPDIGEYPHPLFTELEMNERLSATHLVMRFLCGFAGSAFMSVAGGSVGDLFDDHEISLYMQFFLPLRLGYILIKITITRPMAVYTLSPFLGPSTQ